MPTQIILSQSQIFYYQRRGDIVANRDEFKYFLMTLRDDLKRIDKEVKASGNSASETLDEVIARANELLAQMK